MNNLKYSQYRLKDYGTGSLSGGEPNNGSNNNGSGDLSGGGSNNGSNNSGSGSGNNNPPKVSGDQWLASIAALLSGSSEVIDSINGAANGGSQQNNNNTQASTNNTNTTTKPVNPLWVGLGIGSVVLLIVGLLIYSNKNGNSNNNPSSPSK